MQFELDTEIKTPTFNHSRNLDPDIGIWECGTEWGRMATQVVCSRLQMRTE